MLVPGAVYPFFVVVGRWFCVLGPHLVVHLHGIVATRGDRYTGVLLSIFSAPPHSFQYLAAYCERHLEDCMFSCLCVKQGFLQKHETAKFLVRWV